MMRDLIGTVTGKVGGWLGLDLEYYLKGGFYLILAQAVLMLCGLASSIVLARLLTKEAYGQYNYIFSVIGILTISALPGMGAAIAHAVANNHDRVLITGTWTRLRWSLAGAAVCLGIGFYYHSTGEALLGRCFISASPLFPLYTSLDTFYPFLNGRRRFDLYSRYQSGYWILLTLSIVATVYVTRNLLWVVIVYLAVATLLKAVFLFNTIRRGNLNRNEDKAAVTYGKQLTGIQAIGIAALQFDKLIVGVALGYSDLAIYSIAVMISNLPAIPVQAVSTTIFPKIAVMDETIAYTEVKARLPWLLIAMIIVCGVGAWLCPYVIPWLYSQKYLESVVYTQLLFIPVIVGTPAQVLRRGALQARRKTKELFKVNMVVSVFELALLALFTLKFGLLGIVIARSLARLFDSAYSWILAK